VPLSYAQYTGNGSTTTFSVPFPYLLKAHVKLYTGYNVLDGTFTSQLVDGVGYTWTSGTQVQTTAAPAAGVVLTIIRDTPDGVLLSPWQDGSNLVADDLTTSDLQNLYVVQEQQDVVTLSSALSVTAGANAATALSTANAASTTANGIAGTANTALSNANAAVSTANAASSTANAANATANGIAGTANTALSNANAAVSTANAANATANGIAGTANTALSNANAAVSTANAADATANGIAATANTALSNSSAAVATANAALPKAGGTMTGAITFAGAQPTATTSTAAIVQLSNSISSTSETLAATPKAVKDAKDDAVIAAATGAAALYLPRAGGTMTGGLVAPSLNGGPLGGLRNRIINGAMRIAQRGASFPAAANGYSLDRWQWLQLGAMVCTISQSADIPNNTFQTSYKVDVTTADTSIGSLDYATVAHRIEGHNVRDLIDTTFTLSFWVKSPKAGVHCVGLRNELQDRSFVAPYSVSAVNTWEYKSITVTGGLIAAGGWNWTNGTGLEIAFMLACGAAYHTTASSWNTGNFLATSAQVNVMDSAANDFFLTGVQLEPGPVATPFERRPLGLELELCCRYFQLLTYYGGAYTGANVCYFIPEGFNKFRADPAISSTVNGFQFFNNTNWTSTSTSTGASFSIYTSPIGTRAIQVNGLAGNGTNIPTPTSAAILGTLSAEL
jgi:hypothetical protein